MQSQLTLFFSCFTSSGVCRWLKPLCGQGGGNYKYELRLLSHMQAKLFFFLFYMMKCVQVTMTHVWTMRWKSTSTGRMCRGRCMPTSLACLGPGWTAIPILLIPCKCLLQCLWLRSHIHLLVVNGWWACLAPRLWNKVCKTDIAPPMSSVPYWFALLPLLERISGKLHNLGRYVCKQSAAFIYPVIDYVIIILTITVNATIFVTVTTPQVSVCESSQRPKLFVSEASLCHFKYKTPARRFEIHNPGLHLSSKKVSKT